MTTDDLTAALHACALGIYPLEAGITLLTAEGTFLRRSDFVGRFIEHGTSSGTAMAVINWDAVITALQARASLLRRGTARPDAVCQPRRRHTGRPQFL